MVSAMERAEFIDEEHDIGFVTPRFTPKPSKFNARDLFTRKLPGKIEVSPTEKPPGK